MDYVAKDGQIVIVDEFTGRLMPGRRWSDGLHQAIEAKEGLRIQQENQTLATITFQNYFRMYDKLAGMTGTADTEAAEFAKIYKLDVTVVPTNRALVRVNNPDVVYKTEREKFDAVVQEIKELHEKGRPILIGTVSIEKSERLVQAPQEGRRAGPPGAQRQVPREGSGDRRPGRPDGRGDHRHQHGRPRHGHSPRGQSGVPRPGGAAQARRGPGDGVRRGARSRPGRRPGGSPTRSTSTSSSWAASTSSPPSGTSPGASTTSSAAARDARAIPARPASTSPSRTISSDLRLRADPEDHGPPGDGGREPIEHGLVSRAIQTAQKRVEAHHFEIRKHLLEYDDVMNKQREVVYGMRREILQGESQEETVREWMDEALDGDRRAPTLARACTRRTGISAGSGEAAAPAVRREAPAGGDGARGRVARGRCARSWARPCRRGMPRARRSCPRTSCGRSSGGSCST